jgi:hypothetical protein
MATIKRFEDLDIWQIARELNIKILPLLDKLNESRNYELKSQLDRSAGSVMDNISEGSLGEVRSQLYRALDKSLLEKEKHDLLQEDCLLLASKIAKFISYLNNTEHRGNKFKKETQN